MKGKCALASFIVLIIACMITKRLDGSIEVSSMLIEAEVTQVGEQVEAPKVALTFDDGPCLVEGTTEVLLDGLKKREVQASFFLLGKQADKAPELVQRIYEEGHLIGNHSYSHVNLVQIKEVDAIEEMEDANRVIEKITGEEVWFVRPPFGAWSEGLEEEVPMMTVMWSVDPLDWNSTNVDAIVNKVVTEVEENDIILLHDSFPTSVEAAFRIIDELQAQGYEFVTVDEILMN